MTVALPAKKSVLEAVIAQLQKELAAVNESARAAHAAATHEESRPEDSHDTRGLEASYLAGAQAGRVAELSGRIAAFKFLPLRDFGPNDMIDAGALIELELGARRLVYLLVVEGGGLSVDCEGRRVQVITPQAPLGEELLGRRVGESVELDVQGMTREYTIRSVT